MAVYLKNPDVKLVFLSKQLSLKKKERSTPQHASTKHYQDVFFFTHLQDIFEKTIAMSHNVIILTILELHDCE